MRRNHIIYIPEDCLKAINDGVVVRDTMRFCSDKVGLLYMPESDRLDFDKEVEVGEVVSIGDNVPKGELEVGDFVLYRRLTAFWIPNGLSSAKLWKLEYPFSILCTVPKEHSDGEKQ